MIINEYGQRGVDGALVSDGVYKKEISNGSIFCTCRSDKFVAALAELAGHDEIDDIFVEASGFSDPRSMEKILELAGRLSKATLVYKGMITLISAENFLKLADTLNVIKAQLIDSDLVIINKTDLVSQETLAAVREKIDQINSDARVMETQYAKLGDMDISKLRSCTCCKNTKLPHIKDLSLKQKYIKLPDRVTEKELLAGLEALSPQTMRTKGMAETEKGSAIIDCVGNDIKLRYNNRPVDEKYIILLGNRIPETRIIEQMLSCSDKELDAQFTARASIVRS